MNEEIFTRVTTIANLFSDFSSIDKDVLEAAAIRGTDVHKLCAAQAQGFLVSACPEIYQGYLDSFSQWANENIDSIILCEHRRFCRRYMITGEVDFVVKMKGEETLTLIDIKTSAARYSSWDLQMGGYNYLLKETFPALEIEKALLIRLKKDGGKPIVNRVSDLDAAEDVFFHAFECYNYMKMKPKKIEVE
jgi:hypothetical protein